MNGEKTMQKLNKKGMSLNVYTVIGGIIGLVILFQVVAALLPTFASAGNTINATGYSGASLFASDGFMPLLLIMGVLIVTVGVLIKKGKK